MSLDNLTNIFSDLTKNFLKENPSYSLEEVKNEFYKSHPNFKNDKIFQSIIPSIMG